MVESYIKHHKTLSIKNLADSSVNFSAFNMEEQQKVTVKVIKTEEIDEEELKKVEDMERHPFVMKYQSNVIQDGMEDTKEKVSIVMDSYDQTLGFKMRKV
jgi:hypothetical protein